MRTVSIRIPGAPDVGRDRRSLLRAVPQRRDHILEMRMRAENAGVENCPRDSVSVGAEAREARVALQRTHRSTGQFLLLRTSPNRVDAQIAMTGCNAA